MAERTTPRRRWWNPLDWFMGLPTDQATIDRLDSENMKLSWRLARAENLLRLVSPPLERAADFHHESNEYLLAVDHANRLANDFETAKQRLIAVCRHLDMLDIAPRIMCPWGVPDEDFNEWLSLVGVTHATSCDSLVTQTVTEDGQTLTEGDRIYFGQRPEQHCFVIDGRRAIDPWTGRIVGLASACDPIFAKRENARAWRKGRRQAAEATPTPPSCARPGPGSVEAEPVMRAPAVAEPGPVVQDLFAAKGVATDGC
jgi:hypothetical protein